MGRPRKVNIQGHQSKTEKELRLNYPKSINGFNIPEFLCDEAKQEFIRVVEAYDNIGSLDALDLSVLAVYADAWANYERLAKIIAENGAVLVKKRVTGKIEIQNNPAVAIQAEYVKRIMQCSLKLGMATTDRLRLAVPQVESDEDAFSSFEGGV